MSDFQNKVIYQIYPKSFMDADGDGIGDLQGIIKKLDYLEYLGVDYIWITPFFISPQRDNGYDVADYRNIDPVFGTMKDLEELIAEAEKHDIGLMLDMVFNHTSTEHDWFKRALSGEKKYQDYYIFKKGTPNHTPTNWESKFGGSVWEYIPYLQKWYLHLFDVTQADLNWENPEVREELKEILKFWKNKGIKGFRFDVVNLISKPAAYEDDKEGDGRRFYTDGSKVHDYLKELVRDSGIEELITVGEMSSTTIDNCIRYTNPAEKELSMCFNFHHLKVDYKDGNKWELMEPDIEKLKKLLKQWQLGMQENNGWNAVFWCNHDQPRIVSRFGNDSTYLKQSAKMLATAIHFLRGTPYIYQGEELGMTNPCFTDISQYHDVESLNYYNILLQDGKTKEEALHILSARSRDNSRTPMQWSPAENAGFSKVSPWIGLSGNYPDINAEAEICDETSILSYYRQLIKLRKEKDVIAKGRIAFLMEEEPGLFAYRRYDEEEELIVLNNFEEKSITLDIPYLTKNNYKRLLGNYDVTKWSGKGVVLNPFEAVVFEKV